MQLLYAGWLAMMAAGAAGAAELSPWYAGADFGVAANYARDHQSGRAYLGYRLGKVQALGMQQVQALELVGYSLGLRRDTNFGGAYWSHEEIRANGVGLAWATALNLNDKLALHTRLGAAYTRAFVRQRGGSGGQSYEHGNLLAGVGLSYALSEQVRVRADLAYTPFKLRSNDSLHHTMLSTGLGLAF